MMTPNRKVSTPDDRIIAAMRILSHYRGFSAPDLCEITGCQPTDAARQIRELMDLGLVDPVDDLHPEHGKTTRMYRAKRGALTKKSEHETRGDIRERRRRAMWTAMRNIGAFSLRDLAYSATTDDMQISLNIAQSYIATLLKAGLLLQISVDTQRGGPDPVYRLKPSANSGPKAPASIERGSAVSDPNTGAVWRDGKRTSGRVAA